MQKHLPMQVIHYNKRSPENSLTNRMLYTTGLGIDMVTFYDFIFRFDY